MKHSIHLSVKIDSGLFPLTCLLFVLFVLDYYAVIIISDCFVGTRDVIHVGVGFRVNAER